MRILSLSDFRLIYFYPQVTVSLFSFVLIVKQSCAQTCFGIADTCGTLQPPQEVSLKCFSHGNYNVTIAWLESTPVNSTSRLGWVEMVVNLFICKVFFSVNWCFPLMRSLFFLVDPTMLIFTQPLIQHPSPLQSHSYFLGVTFDNTLFFSKHLCYLRFFMWLFEEVPRYETFLGPFSLMLHSDNFLFLALPNGNTFTVRLVALLPAASPLP